MNMIKKTGLFVAAVALASCTNNPVEVPEDVGAITGLVIIGSAPAPNVQVALDGGDIRSTDASGKFRFVDLTVGDLHEVAIVSGTLPDGAEMHLADTTITVPKTRVAFVNFYGSRERRSP